MVFLHITMRTKWNAHMDDNIFSYICSVLHDFNNKTTNKVIGIGYLTIQARGWKQYYQTSRNKPDKHSL